MTTLAQALPRRRSLGLAWIRRYVLTVYAALALVYLFLPIAIVVLFSFNNPAGRFNYTWQGFTFKNWTHPFSYPGLWPALRLSLQIAVLASLVATALGTLIALALVRYGFRGRGLSNLLIFVPMTTPEVVMGASLLALFVSWRVAQGFLTIFIAHVLFNISYVVVTVKARLVGFDRHLEEAAMDLGANEWTTFQKVTLPLIAPGIMAAMLLSFALSVDDFVITYFNAGPKQTFPLFVWGTARFALPPQIYVIGTAIFVVAVGGMLANIVFQNTRARRAGLAKE
jgi:spermidine/putrescine transport system permease protein